MTAHAESGKEINHLAIAAGLVLGLAFGLVASATGIDVLMAVATGVRPIGDLFVNAVRMVVIPLVVAIVFLGVARLGDPRKLGRLGGFSVAFFWLTTVVAIFVGMGLMRVGLAFSPDVTAPYAAEQVAPELPGVVEFLVSLIPSNPFGAAAEGALLPLIVFTVLFAAAAGTLEEKKREPLLTLADSVTETLIRLVHWILWTAPLGVFALAAPVTAESGWAMLQSLAIFVVVVAVGLVLFVAVVYLPLVRFLGRMGVAFFLRGIVGSQVIAFGSTSSAASLPVMLEEAEEKLGLSEEVYGLVLSIAASLNRAGSALYQGAAIVFLAYLYEVPLPAVALGGAALATFLVALTIAPVPSASVVTLAPALDAVGIPMAGLAVLFGVDRIPDMFRTATNVTGHMACAVVVEGLTREDGAGQAASDLTME
jgi:Na+/H+-dicarboxylate symporter